MPRDAGWVAVTGDVAGRLPGSGQDEWMNECLGMRVGLLLLAMLLDGCLGQGWMWGTRGNTTSRRIYKIDRHSYINEDL